jgi:hypothetical protein
MKLNKFLAAASLAFLFTSAAHAENRIGVLAGIDVNKLSGEVASTGSSTGFMGGVFGQYDYNGSLFGEVQLRYITKGGETSSPTTEASTSADWLELPIYAKYKFVTQSGFMPYVFAGPALAVKLGSSAEGLDRNTGIRAEGDGDFNGFDLGLDFGVGAEYPIYGNFNLSLNAAYNLGLLDVIDTGSAQNRGFQFYAGLSMPY